MKLLVASSLLLLAIVGSEAASLQFPDDDTASDDLEFLQFPADDDTHLDFLRKAPIGRSKIKTLSNSMLRRKKVYVIGDVHGCLKELQALLKKMGVLSDPRRPERGLKRNAIVIIAGDLVNRGPHSRGVMEYVRTTRNLLTIRGNHEQYYWNRDKNDKYARWIDTLPYCISIPKYNSYVVHAGMLPKIAPKDQSKFTVTQMRNVIVGRRGSLTPIRGFREGTHWAKIWSKDSRKMIYFGHDGYRGRHGPQIFRSATGIDTRCAKGGSLTAVELPGTKKFISYKCTKGCKK